jgi:hypothetical protein
MTSIPPPSEDARARKRPWYLVVALVLVSLTGVTAAADGCGMVGYYRGTLPLVDQPIGDGVTDEDRQMIQAAALQVETAREQDRHILFPLAAGGLVLGMAMFAFATAAMAGRDGARRAVTQLVAVRAVMLCVEFATTKREREAEQELRRAHLVADIHATHNVQAEQVIAQSDASLKRLGPSLAVGGVVVRILAFGLVVLALTRQRTRQFYEAAGEAFADD